MTVIEAVDFSVYNDTELLDYVHDLRNLYRHFKDAGKDAPATMAKAELDRAEWELRDRGLSI